MIFKRIKITAKIMLNKIEKKNSKTGTIRVSDVSERKTRHDSILGESQVRDGHERDHKWAYNGLGTSKLLPYSTPCLPS